VRSRFLLSLFFSIFVTSLKRKKEEDEEQKENEEQSCLATDQYVYLSICDI